MKRLQVSYFLNLLFANGESFGSNCFFRSYADIYQRNAQSEIPRGGLDLLNYLLSGPQQYPLPGVAGILS